MHCKACDAPLSGNLYKVFKDPITEIEYPFEEELCNYCLGHVFVEEHIEEAMIKEGYWNVKEVPQPL